MEEKQYIDSKKSLSTKFCEWMFSFFAWGWFKKKQIQNQYLGHEEMDLKKKIRDMRRRSSVILDRLKLIQEQREQSEIGKKQCFCNCL